MKITKRRLLFLGPLALLAVPISARLSRLVGMDDATNADGLVGPDGVERTDSPVGTARVVAAHNSSALSKATATYLCDGDADQLEIQHAIDSLPPSGGRVQLLEGDFVLSKPLSLRNHVNIAGAGKYATRLHAPDGFVPLLFEDNGFSVAQLEIIVGQVGRREETLTPALSLDGLRDATFADLKIVRRGRFSGEGAISVVEAWGETSSTVTFTNCDIACEVEEGPTYRVVYTQDASSPVFSHCTIKGSSGARGFNLGVACSGGSSPTFVDCTIDGGDGGTENLGVYVLVSAQPIFQGCDIKSGNDGRVATRSVGTDGATAAEFTSCRIVSGHSSFGNAAAVHTNAASIPRFNNCTIAWGDGPAQGASIGRSSSPIFRGCTLAPISHAQTWLYDSARNGRFRPFAKKPYQVIAIQLYRIVLRPGVTVDIGTTPGGSDIASRVPLDAPGSASMSFERVEIGADQHLYATPSAPIGGGDFIIYYSVVVDYPDSPAINLATKGYPLFDGCMVTANGASNGVEINHDAVDAMRWKIARCHLETLGPHGQFAVHAVAEIGNAPILFCDFVGGFKNVTSLMSAG